MAIARDARAGPGGARHRIGANRVRLSGAKPEFDAGGAGAGFGGEEAA